MRTSAPRLAGWLVILVGLGPGRVAGAAPTAAAPSARRARAPARYDVVMMAERSQPAFARDLQRAVAAQLSDAPVRLRMHWLAKTGADLRRELGAARTLAGKGRVIVVFWCDLKGSDDVYLFLSEPGGGRLLVRRVPRAAAAARAESVAIIVGTSVRAFLQRGVGRPARRRIAPRPRPRTVHPRVALRSPPRTRPAPPWPRVASGPERPGLPTPPDGTPILKMWKKPRPTRLSLTLSYSVDSYNEEVGALHGANISISYHFSPRWSSFASFRVMQSIDRRKTDEALGVDVSVTLQRYPISFGGGIHWNVGRLRFGGTLAFGVDYVAVEARNEREGGPALTVNDDRGDWHYFLAPEIRLGVRVVHRLWVQLAFGAEVYLYTRKYHVDDESTGQAIDVLMPWYVQPYARLGLRLDLF